MHEDVNLPLALIKQAHLPKAKQILLLLVNKALQLEDLNAFETYVVYLPSISVCLFNHIYLFCVRECVYITKRKRF